MQTSHRLTHETDPQSRNLGLKFILPIFPTLALYATSTLVEVL